MPGGPPNSKPGTANRLGQGADPGTLPTRLSRPTHRTRRRAPVLEQAEMLSPGRGKVRLGPTKPLLRGREVARPDPVSLPSTPGTSSAAVPFDPATSRSHLHILSDTRTLSQRWKTPVRNGPGLGGKVTPIPNLGEIPIDYPVAILASPGETLTRNHCRLISAATCGPVPTGLSANPSRLRHRGHYAILHIRPQARRA